MVCYLFNEEGFISYGDNTPNWLSEILKKSTTNPHMPYMKINLHVNWTLISCYKQTSLPQNRLDVSPSLSLLFQGNWFGPVVINQMEAFLPGGGTPHMKGGDARRLA